MIEHQEEIDLWNAVLLQAISDATFLTPDELKKAVTSSRKIIKRVSIRDVQDVSSARKYIRLGNPDFVEVCRLAQIDPEYVYRKTMHAIKTSDDVLSVTVETPNFNSLATNKAEMCSEDRREKIFSFFNERKRIFMSIIKCWNRENTLKIKLVENKVKQNETSLSHA